MNTNLTSVSFSVDDIRDGAGKLNTSVKLYSQEVLVRYEPTTIQLPVAYHTTRTSGS